jgi:hypothetical protein
VCTASSSSHGTAFESTVTAGTLRAATTRLPLSVIHAGRVGPAKAKWRPTTAPSRR